MKEVELKFLLDEEGEAALRTRLRGIGGRSQTRELISVYFDTPDGALRQAGIALRLRKIGRRWVQTLKAGRKMRAGLSVSEEAECPAPGGRLALDAVPLPELRDALAEALNGSPPVPVFETRMSRTSRVLELGSGRVELAIDRGAIVADGREAPLMEAELELVEGDRAALFDAVRKVLPEGGLRFSGRSKAERGYLLAEKGHAVDPARTRNARAVPLSPEGSTEEAARDILLECLEQIAANAVAMRERDDPEGPHQLRIGLRRLRSALSLLRPALGGPGAEALEAEARWLGAEIGRLRDIDVLVSETLAPPTDGTPEDPGLATLREAFAKEGAARRAQCRALLSGPRVQGFLIDLAAFVGTRGWLRPEDYGQTALLAAPLRQTAALALAKRWKAAARHGKRIEDLPIPERHELRKALKKLRYGVEFLGPAFPTKRVKPFLKRLKAMQEILGELNDWAVAEELLADPKAPGADDPAAQRAAGRVLGRAEARADRSWLGARGLWRELAGARPFWE